MAHELKAVNCQYQRVGNVPQCSCGWRSEIAVNSQESAILLFQAHVMDKTFGQMVILLESKEKKHEPR